MLRSSLFLMCFFSLSLLLAQADIHLTAHPWQVSTDSQQADEQPGLVGHKFYFYGNGQLLISTPKGSLSTTYEQKEGALFIAGQSHAITEEAGVLSLVSSANGRSWQLERAEVGMVTQDIRSLKRGKFPLDGFYHRVEDSNPVSYHYYRFYADGELLYFHSIIPPAAIEPFLNKAYVSNEQEVRGYTIQPIAQTETDAQFEYVAVRYPAKGPDAEPRELFREATFQVMGDSIQLSQTNQWNYSERAYSQEYQMAFTPFTHQSSWIGQALTPGEAGAAHELLPLPQIPEAEVVLLSVDEMPRYPGCEEVADEKEREECAMNKLLIFLYSNISYPAIARENGVQGTCVINYIVEKDGRVTNARIVRDVGAGCGQEALRVVQMMQDQGIRWIPGQMYGRPVRVEFNLPVTFRLEGRTREKKSRRRRN